MFFRNTFTRYHLNVPLLSQVSGLLKPAAAEEFSRMTGHMRKGLARTWTADTVMAGVRHAFFQDSEDNAPYFAGNRSSLRAMIREDETVQEFFRLNSAL